MSMQIKNEILTRIQLTITYYREIAFATTTSGIENRHFKVANTVAIVIVFPISGVHRNNIGYCSSSSTLSGRILIHFSSETWGKEKKTPEIVWGEQDFLAPSQRNESPLHGRISRYVRSQQEQLWGPRYYRFLFTVLFLWM